MRYFTNLAVFLLGRRFDHGLNDYKSPVKKNVFVAYYFHTMTGDGSEPASLKQGETFPLGSIGGSSLPAMAPLTMHQDAGVLRKIAEHMRLDLVLFLLGVIAATSCRRSSPTIS